VQEKVPCEISPSVQCKLKTVHLDETCDSGGELIVGTSYGEVIVLSLGTIV
jgi:hypothetical protein